MPRQRLNRGPQPFQGWLLPELSVDSTKLNSENLPSFDLFIGAKMEPILKSEPAEICLDFDSQLFRMYLREGKTKTTTD